ncbi:histone acetyltransferase HAC2 [Eutrema salsugineum]|uniref:histone acetyltransferase HAC2 n=1 Tax=Eutrema salsugineum TaxID=72664 RepID=UPI000CED1CE1|nr:histone acetyltransferase HAC2 [Eutrema salsugineum]
MSPPMYLGMMPTYLKPKPNQQETDMFNQQLNMLPDWIGSRKATSHHMGIPRQLNVRSDEKEELLGETFQSETGYYPSKRQRTETPTKSNLPSWSNTFRLPPLKLRQDPTLHNAGFTAEQKVSTPPKSFEEVSSYARGYFPTSTVPVCSNFVVDKVSETASGCSDITKLDLVETSPLDNKHVQGLGTSKNTKPARGAIRVYSLDDLFSSDRATQAEERPLKHEKMGSGVDVVEPMKCDELIKCEFNTHTMSLQNRNKRDVSLVERFTEEEIRLHIKSLKEASIQGCIRETCDLKEEGCQLCGEGPLLFPAQPIYCSLCPRRIKEKSTYYIPEEKIGDAQHQICNPCYSRCRSKFILSGFSLSKANLLKKNNADNQHAEEWVCCGSCGKWQHQICGLYNIHKDIDKTADYICPFCLLEERTSINNTGLLDNTDLGAKDLPETILSHFIERRLFRRLKEERYQTAKATGKSINDVLEPDDLTLRVVFSADKTSFVNKTFADLLHKEHYPSEFPYRSKVILLFQKVEGVDICIFALFVQEFGSECSLPNQRSIYIIYLDSVKYFRPERVTFSGEALRTFVYHEILIAYLEYCKIRGFTTGYIWACPPPKGEDYIMYSHPKTQQTPNTKKLRQWYVSMLDKAAEQRVVTNVTNLYDRFFVSREDSTCNITAARLPYFEGSFWSYNAELLVQEIERGGSNELQKKVKSISRRALKGVMSNKSKDGVDVDDAKNFLLMQKLEKMISQNKEDFMVVDLNYSCTRCSEAILSGLRWFCEKCKNLQLCERCHNAEQELPGEHTHNMNGKEKHSLSKAQVNGIQSTTEDNDVILRNSVLESRQEFLGFSQKHNYGFDTLRRAKHSSMMILHHLHTSNKHHRSENSSSLLQVTCTACKKDVSTTIYYTCLICSGYRACTRCFTESTILRQLHLFPIVPSTHGTPPRTVGALGMLDALLHAHACRSTATDSCSYPKCNDVKTLFSHREVCDVKERGACKICMNFWKMIRIHAYHCQDPGCPLPRCRDMKQYFIRNGVNGVRL